MRVGSMMLVAILAAFGAAACSGAPTGAGAGPALPTLVVHNPDCTAGGCHTLEVRAFAWNFTVPQPLWGFEVVGEADSREVCLTFPPEWTLHVNGPSDTTAFTWTPSDPIFLTAWDSAGFHSSSTTNVMPYLRGITQTFTPGGASGWGVPFSGDSTWSGFISSSSRGNSTVAAAPACR